MYGVTRCISWSDSHEVTTFLTLDNVYILVCTDCLVLSDVYIPLVVRIGLYCPNKASLQVDCILQLLRFAVGLLVELSLVSLIVVFDLRRLPMT